eukprot:7380174-Prymnesium_polylepis.1
MRANSPSVVHVDRVAASATAGHCVCVVLWVVGRVLCAPVARDRRPLTACMRLLAGGCRKEFCSCDVVIRARNR